METEWGVWMNSSEIYLGQLLPSVEKYILWHMFFSIDWCSIFVQNLFFFQISQGKTRKSCFKWESMHEWNLDSHLSSKMGCGFLSSGNLASHLVSPYAPSQGSGQSWQLKPGEGFVLFDDLSQFLITSQSSPVLHRVWYGWFPLYLFERPIECREWENWLFWEDVAIKRPNIGETFGLSHTRDEQENLFNCK